MKSRVGIVGCGNISGIYFENMCNVFNNLEVVACADLVQERAEAKAAKYPGVKVMPVDDLLASPDIDIVVNLTIPKAHHEVALRALQAGKHAYNEKPLTLTREQGLELLATAEEKGVLVGSAPDTFLGGGIQTCRQLIDEGVIGEPIGCTAFMTCPGHERWHPDPEFYYKTGGGPVFDMGPYYITALLSLIGPVKSVSGSTRISFPQRTIGSPAKYGTKIDVEVPTHVAGTLDFANGAIGTMIMSFDVWGAHLPRIEIFGSEGTLSVPDPNGFGGPVSVRRPEYTDWVEMTLTHSYPKNSRGLGVADMAAAAAAGRQNRVNGKLAYHALDIMHGLHDSADQGKRIDLQSTCDRPDPLPPRLAPGEVE